MIRIVPLACVLALLVPAPALADDPPAPTPAPAPTQAPAPAPAPTQAPAPAPAPPSVPAAPAPSAAELEAAKKAFAEGKKLHGQGKHVEAVEKFKESYRLSRNPLLLYNIAFTLDEAKEADMALYYYRKFLKDAPPEAEQRAPATERVKLLEQQFNPNGATPEPSTTAPRPDGPRRPVVIKPAGTYNANDFEHQIVETAPPAKPLDVTASVPDDSGFVVTLFYRTAGEGKYASKVMNWRYRELVGRIPAPKMIGNAVQYYLEVKDAAGTLITRSGKSTSPNLVNLEAGAPPSFYPDLTEDGEGVLSTTEIRNRDDEDDPLNRGKKVKPEEELVVPGPPPPPPIWFRDVGSQKFFYTKWASTGAAAGLGGLSLVFYIQAVSYARRVQDDHRDCEGAPPCRTYDTYAAGLQTTGQRYAIASQVAFGLGAAATAVAGYFWYMEYRANRRGERKVSTKNAARQGLTWGVAPAAGGGLLGAATGRRF